MNTIGQPMGIQPATQGNSSAFNTPVASGSAAQSYADMTRQQWSDYVQNFVPIENQLISYATNEGNITGAVNRAMTNVDQSFEAQQGMQQRRLKGLGVELTPEQKAASDRETALSKSLSEVQGANSARMGVVQNQLSLMGGPSAPKVA